MAFFLQKETVQLACSCGSLKPIYRLYFCRHCQKIRCAYCVSHEVESHYCCHCLENVASADARLRKNCCSNCNNCPVCSHVLSTRIVQVTTASPEDPSKTVARKMYYLVCSFCRWTTRDVDMQDQTSATGGWPEREVPHAQRLSSLLDYYKGVATKERQDKDKKKYVPRRSYLHFYDKFGLSTMLARKRAGLGPLSTLGYKDDSARVPELAPAVASEQVDDLPDAVFTEALDLSKVSTLQQRLAQVEVQPASVTELMPVHKPLLVKRSLRCRECEHNVSKPETGPSSTKFKIQLFAFYHVPEVRVITCEPLRPGCESQLILKLCNPTQHQTSLTFLPLPSAEEDQQQLETYLQEKHRKKAAEHKGAPGREDATAVLQSFTRQLSASEDPRPVKVQVTADVVLPESLVVLPPRDDAAEYDDTGDTHAPHDDPKTVAWRKGNKVAVKLGVVPHQDLGAPGAEVRAGFLLQYTYVSTIPSLERKTPQQQELQARVYLSLGPTLGT